MDTQRPQHLLSADGNPMTVTANIEAEVKLGSIAIPCDFAVVKQLSFDAILGLDFLKTAKAVIDVTTNTVSLYDGLTKVAMSRTGNHVNVIAKSNITIPPRSEAIIAGMTRQS